LGEEARIAYADDAIDESREPLPLVASGVALGELIGRLIAGEGLIPLPCVVEVLPERVAQVDLLGERERPAQQSLYTLEPDAILTPHAPMRGDAAVRGRAIWIECDCALEQLLRVLEPASVLSQLAKQRQRRAASPRRG